MNIIFFGTSGFAVASLKALAGSGHRVLLVVTQPDRKKGRYLKLTPPPVKEITSGMDIPVFQPQDASSPESIERLRALKPDLFVVVSFGQLLSGEVLSLPKKFSINLHASLLPRYRGAAPINWAIIQGEETTGVSVFRLEEGMDSGDIILDKAVPVDKNDDAVTLAGKLSEIGADVLADTIGLIEEGKAGFRRQDEKFVSFAPKLKKSDGLINWDLPAINLHNLVRGLLPWPGAFTHFKGKIIKILSAETAPYKDNGERPGQIIGIERGAGIIVKAKEGALQIQKLQLEGSKPMGFEEFARGHSIQGGRFI